MSRSDVVLLAAPNSRRDHWAAVAAAWPASAGTVAAPAPDVADRRPHGIAWVSAHATALHAEAGWGSSGTPLILVGHGMSGPLLPALARTQRSAGRRIAGYVFVDATLPRPGVTTHLDLLRAAAPAEADAAHETLHEAGSTWPRDAARPGDHDFWTDPLPPAIDWPDAPCGYLTTSATAPGCGPVDFWARSAAARGWTVRESAGTVPDQVASALADLILALPGS